MPPFYLLLYSNTLWILRYISFISLCAFVLSTLPDPCWVLLPYAEDKWNEVIIGRLGENQTSAQAIIHSIRWDIFSNEPQLLEIKAPACEQSVLMSTIVDNSALSVL